MNEHISSVLITKNEDTDILETIRFLPTAWRESKQFNLVSTKRKLRSSMIVDRMGGELRLEALVMYLSQRVLDDSSLSPVFGSFSLAELVVLLGDMMWYTLDDSFDARIEAKKHLKSKVLKKCCRLGLMQETEYFDRFAQHFLSSMRMCSFRNTRTVAQLGDRFLCLRVALQEVADRMARKKSIIPTTIFSFLRNPVSQCTRRSHTTVVSDMH